MYPCDFSRCGAGCQAAGTLVSWCPAQLAGSRIAQVSAVALTGKELVELVEEVESLNLRGSSVSLSSWAPATSASTASGSLFTFNCVCSGPVCVSLWAVGSLGHKAWCRMWEQLEEGAGGQGKQGLVLAHSLWGHKAGPQQIGNFSIWATIHEAFFTSTKI